MLMSVILAVIGCLYITCVALLFQPDARCCRVVVVRPGLAVEGVGGGALVVLENLDQACFAGHLLADDNDLLWGFHHFMRDVFNTKIY